MTITEILAAIARANRAAVAIDGLVFNKLERLHEIGSIAASVIAAAPVVDVDGKNVTLRSGNAFAKASGIPQKYVSQGLTLHKAFPSAAKVVAAYVAQDKTTGVDEFVSLFATGKSNASRKPVSPVVAELKRCEKLTKGQKRQLVEALAAELGLRVR